MWLIVEFSDNTAHDFIAWQKAVIEMKPGNCINVPVGIKHWHGVALNSWFSHLAIEVPGEDTSNEWLEEVNDEHNIDKSYI